MDLPIHSNHAQGASTFVFGDRRARLRAIGGQSALNTIRLCSRRLLLRRWAIALILLGILWRTVRYLWQFPIWGDESFICLNLLDRSYRELIQPLRFNQVAPLLFLWGEATAYRLLGSTELAVRLLPFLAGLGSLALFWRLAHLALSSQAGLFAAGIFSVAYYPVRHSCEVKPYAFDLLVSSALMLLAVAWLREPGRLLRLVLLATIVPVALGLSYPAVLITGAISVALLPAVCRQPGWSAKIVYVTYNVLMVVCFAGYYCFAGLGQHASMDKDYWQAWFPPADSALWLGWLCKAHTGNMFAYPVGGHNGASTLTALLCLVGLWQVGRSRCWPLLTLLLVPFLLTLIAAALHRYPYGGSARVAQHLAPAICLLAGNGLAVLVGKMPLLVAHRRASVAVFCLLLLVGTAGLVRDVLKPYKSEDDRFVRHAVVNLLRRSAGEGQIVIMDPSACIGPTFEWYLRQAGDRVSWDGRIDWQRLDRPQRQLWCLYFNRPDAIGDRCSVQPDNAPYRLILADHQERELRLGSAEGRREYFAVYHWVCEDDAR